MPGVTRGPLPSPSLVALERGAGQQLLAHEAEQRLVIKQQAQQIFTLKSELSHWTWVRFKQLEEENATLRERDEIAKWYKAYIEQCEQEIARLREALGNIVEGEGLWTKNDMAREAQQALKEQP